MIKDCNIAPEPQKEEIKNLQLDPNSCRPQNVVKIHSKSIEKENKPSVVQINSTGRSNCILYKDLLPIIRIKAKEVISDYNQDDIKYFTNIALETLWNFNNPIKWNWTLEDFEIVLDGDSARYRLPNDFYGLSGVSYNDTKRGFVPSKGYFNIVPSHQWDSVQLGNYITYKAEYDGFYLYIRTKDMARWNNLGCNLTGSIFVKYYTAPPVVEDLDSKICKIPFEWGAKSILLDLIVLEMYAGRGKQYPQVNNLELLLQTLKKLDTGEQIRDNLYKKQPVSFSIAR